MSEAPKARRVFGMIAALSAAMLAAACAAGSPGGTATGGGDETPAIAGEVVWADYGGPTNEARVAHYFDSFFDSTGVEVISTPLQDAVLFEMLDGGPGDYDVMQGSADVFSARTEHMLEIPEEAQGDLIPENMRPYVLGGFVFGIAQGWKTSTFPDGGPQDWADFFDTERFPGKRAWPGTPASFDGSFEIALLADGVPADELYPLDIERAKAKLDTIRDELVFYTAYPEVQQLIISDSVAIAVTVTGQFTNLMKAGEDITIQWNEAFVVPTGFAVPETANNPEAAFALGAWMNDPERQAAFVEQTLYGPADSAVFDHLPEDIAANLVNSPRNADKVLGWDYQWRGENYDMLINEYGGWLSNN